MVSHIKEGTLTVKNSARWGVPGSKRKRVAGKKWNCIMRSFIIYTLHEILSQSYQIQNNEKAEMCRVQRGRRDMHTQFYQKT
jgi:hypothetical protein